MEKNNLIFPLLNDILIQLDSLRELKELFKVLSHFDLKWHTGDSFSDTALAELIWKEVSRKGTPCLDILGGRLVNHQILNQDQKVIQFDDFKKLFINKHEKHYYIEQTLDSKNNQPTFRIFSKHFLHKSYLYLDNKVAEFNELSTALNYTKYLTYFKLRSAICV